MVGFAASAALVMAVQGDRRRVKRAKVCQFIECGSHEKVKYRVAVCKELLNVENTSEPSMMFEEDEIVEMQPVLGVNKRLHALAPSVAAFALRAGYMSVVAVSSR
jgi:hypothetical protein